jgi:hypothetical protein
MRKSWLPLPWLLLESLSRNVPHSKLLSLTLMPTFAQPACSTSPTFW